MIGSILCSIESHPDIILLKGHFESLYGEWIVGRKAWNQEKQSEGLGSSPGERDDHLN